MWCVYVLRIGLKIREPNDDVGLVFQWDKEKMVITPFLPATTLP